LSTIIFSIIQLYVLEIYIYIKYVFISILNNNLQDKLQSRVYVDVNMLIPGTAFYLHNNINLQTFRECWQTGQDARKFQVAKLRRSMIASSRLQSSA